MLCCSVAAQNHLVVSYTSIFWITIFCQDISHILSPRVSCRRIPTTGSSRGGPWTGRGKWCQSWAPTFHYQWWHKHPWRGTYNGQWTHCLQYSMVTGSAEVWRRKTCCQSFSSHSLLLVGCACQKGECRLMLWGSINVRFQVPVVVLR